MARRAVILGGTGQVGRAVAGALLRDGWAVSLVHRGQTAAPAWLLEAGATEVLHDRERAGDLGSAIGRGADLVVDAIAFDAGHADQLLEVQADVGAFVVLSSSSVYRDADGRTLDEAGEGGFPDVPLPMTEEQPTVEPGPETYSTSKVALERRLLDRATTPVTILRPCAIHGVGSSHPREWWFVKRMLDGRPAIPLAFRGESRFHTTAAANIAGLVGVVAEAPATRILNIGDDPCLSVAEIGAAIGRHLGYEGRFVLLDDDGPQDCGFTPWSVPAPFVIDSSAARALGFAPLSYEATVGPTCDWLVELASEGDWRARLPVFGRYPRDPFDYRAEDEVLSRMGLNGGG